MTDFLDEKRQEITARLKELAPLVQEYHRLEEAAAALGGISGSAAAGVAPSRRRPGRPPGSVSKTAAAPVKAARKKPGRPPGKPGRPKKVGRPAGSAKAAAPSKQKRRAGRRKGSGTRAAQAHAFVRGQPGITIPELAAKMGIKQNYLYRVLPALAQENKVEQKGRGWHPKG